MIEKGRILIIILLIFCIHAQAEKTTRLVERKPTTVLKKKYTIEELAADFRQFRHLVETTAVHPYRFTTKVEFGRLFSETEQAFDRPMTLREFYTLLLPLKARIGCGHCHLDYPVEYRRTVQVFKFPLILIFLGDRCYVRENLQPKTTVLKYSEITAINGIKTPKIIRTLKADISADGYNEQFKTAALTDCFQYYYANRYGAPKEYRIELSTEQSATARSGVQTITIPAVPCSGINYSNKKPSKLRFKILPQKDTAIMTVHSFIYYGKKNKIFFDYVDKAFRQIKEKKIGNLIIDLRGNGGGDPFCSAHLLSYIEREPSKYFAQPYGKYARLAEPIPLAENRFTGNLYFLTDGSNFSTTGHFCGLLKYHNLGTFVGTETGSTYTCNAAVKRFHLEHTRILSKLSTQSFAAAVSGLSAGRGIVPHHHIEPTIDDIKKGKDAVMDFTLDLIKNKRGKGSGKGSGWNSAHF